MKLTRQFFVAQIGNLLYRRLTVGGRLRIANPRHGRLTVCATVALTGCNRFGLIRSPALPLALALALANGPFAAAQSNNVPGPTDYAAFSRFVSERNIFDPNRVPRNSQNTQRTNIRQTRTNRSAPSFTLVGTMSYEKGMFAFFSGNNSELCKVLYQSDSNSIAGFTVAKITLAAVQLQSTDKKQTVEMKIGDAMRQEGSAWQPAGQGELSAVTSTNESETLAAADAAGGDANTPPASAAESSDILKRLMQQREKELK